MSKSANVERFLIELECVDEPVFYPGQRVAGSVIFWNNNPETFKEFYVKLKGVGHVSWSTGSGDSESNYSAYETYCEMKTPLIGQQSQEGISINTGKEETIKLAPGRYIFPFAFVLPINIPSSYSFSTGYVCYNLRAKMKKSLFNLARVPEIRFKVNDMVDLNALETAMIAPAACLTKEASLFHSGTIKVEAWLDRAGYTPGETIELYTKIECTTGKTVRKIKIRLVQLNTFKSRSSSCQISNTIYNLKQELNASEKKQVDIVKYPITVPNVPASGKPFCNIIEISYNLQFIVDYAKTSTNIIAKLPLVIGNVSLRRPPMLLGHLGPQDAQHMTTSNQGNPPESPPPPYE